jgi:hypothetical protein
MQIKSVYPFFLSAKFFIYQSHEDVRSARIVCQAENFYLILSIN